MNPSATRQFRTGLAALAVAWAGLALALSLSGQLFDPPALHLPLRTSVLAGRVNVYRPNQVAAEAGAARGDRLVAVDGVPALRWLRERGLQGLQQGVSNRYRLEKPDGRVLDLELQPEPTPTLPTLATPLYVAQLAVGLAYLVIGIAVWRLRPARADSFALLLFCATMGAQLFLSVESYRAWLGPERLLVNLPFLGATIFHLFTIHPFEPGWAVRHRRVRMLPYAAAGALALLVPAHRALGLSLELVSRVAFFYSVGLGLLSFGTLALERHRHRDAEKTARADVVFIGASVSFVPVIALLLFQALTRFAFPTELALLWFVLFPVAMAYGIVRRQLFDIRLVARSSVAYGAATLFITGLFALLIVFADAAVARFRVNAQSPWFQIVFLFFAILAFNPLRVWLQGFVDRVFDRDRLAYRQAVREISEAMVSMLSIREIVNRILTALTDTMGVERAMVLLLDERDATLRPEAWRGAWDPEAIALDLPSDHPVARRLWLRREELWRSEFDDEPDSELRETCREIFDRLEVELIVPILFGVDVLGLIAVGRKLAGERLGADDRQLLRTLANQSAIAIENAKAFDEIAQLNETLEARVEERTRELRDTQHQLIHSERIKSLGQLVAGIAHELNNPIGFVHANLKLLDEYVPRLLELQARGEDTTRAQQAIDKLLTRSREGTERVKKIVEDLRVFSRADRSELAEADLNREIDRTLALMEPRLRNDVRVRRDYGTLPQVRCHAGQLNQVFMNLVMNACDAAGRGGEIQVRTRPTAGGVRLEFEDDGPGIPAELRSRIFDPFFTTKPVGPGTGLGLSLSHGIVERHGGRIWAEESAAGGARFVIELPREAPEVEPAVDAAAGG